MFVTECVPLQRAGEKTAASSRPFRCARSRVTPSSPSKNSPPFSRSCLGHFNRFAIGLSQVRLWLGLEEHQSSWRTFCVPGDLNFFAETFENEKRIHPADFGPYKINFSNEDLDLPLPKEAFDGGELPRGWRWEGE